MQNGDHGDPIANGPAVGKPPGLEDPPSQQVVHNHGDHKSPISRVVPMFKWPNFMAYKWGWSQALDCPSWDDRGWSSKWHGVWIIQVDGVVQLKPLAVKKEPLVVKKVHGKLYPVMSEWNNSPYEITIPTDLINKMEKRGERGAVYIYIYMFYTSWICTQVYYVIYK